MKLRNTERDGRNSEERDFIYVSCRDLMERALIVSLHVF